MAEATGIWVAVMDTGTNNSMGFGATPQQALTALVELWVEKHCPAADDEVAYPWNFREGIEIAKAGAGTAVMFSGGSELWFDDAIKGDDPRFAATLDELAKRYEVLSANAEEASAYLRKAFGALSAAIEAYKVDFGKLQYLLGGAMAKMRGLIDEDPNDVDTGDLVEAATNLRETFDALRLAAVTDWDSQTRDVRREHAARYHTMSFNVKRLANVIVDLREAPVPGI